MQKNFTSLKKTDLYSQKKNLDKTTKMQPSTTSLQRILQFASSYRVEKIGENQFVELNLN